MSWRDPDRPDVRPFLAVAVAGLLTLLLPPYAGHGAVQAVAGAAGAALTGALALLLRRLPAGSRLVAVPRCCSSSSPGSPGWRPAAKPVA